VVIIEAKWANLHYASHLNCGLVISVGDRKKFLELEILQSPVHIAAQGIAHLEWK